MNSAQRTRAAAVALSSFMIATSVCRPLGAGRRRAREPQATAAKRMRLHREPRRQGLRCLTIELRETEVSELIQRGFLHSEDQNEPEAVRKALYLFLDRAVEATRPAHLHGDLVRDAALAAARLRAALLAATLAVPGHFYPRLK